MAITAAFTPQSMNASQYDEIIRRLEAAGAGSPPGRLHHVCFGTGSNLRVLDIWESEETLRAFGETLMPILQEIGVDPGQPEINAVHNTIAG
jgi:hypothetical protein